MKAKEKIKDVVEGVKKSVLRKANDGAGGKTTKMVARGGGDRLAALHTGTLGCAHNSSPPRPRCLCVIQSLVLVLRAYQCDSQGLTSLPAVLIVY